MRWVLLGVSGNCSRRLYFQNGQEKNDCAMARTSLWAGVLLSVGCAAPSAWIIEQRPGGGVIGYSVVDQDDSKQVALKDQAIQAQVFTVCGSSKYHLVRDRLQSQEYQYSTVVPVTSQTNGTATATTRINGDYRTRDYSSGDMYRGSYDGQASTDLNYSQTTTAYVPQQRTGVAYWRQLEFSCAHQYATSPYEAASPETSTRIDNTGAPGASVNASHTRKPLPSK